MPLDGDLVNELFGDVNGSKNLMDKLSTMVLGSASIKDEGTGVLDRTFLDTKKKWWQTIISGAFSFLTDPSGFEASIVSKLLKKAKSFLHKLPVIGGLFGKDDVDAITPGIVEYETDFEMDVVHSNAIHSMTAQEGRRLSNHGIGNVIRKTDRSRGSVRIDKLYERKWADKSFRIYTDTMHRVNIEGFKKRRCLNLKEVINIYEDVFNKSYADESPIMRGDFHNEWVTERMRRSVLHRVIVVSRVIQLRQDCGIPQLEAIIKAKEADVSRCRKLLEKKEAENKRLVNSSAASSENENEAKRAVDVLSKELYDCERKLRQAQDELAKANDMLSSGVTPMPWISPDVTTTPKGGPAKSHTYSAQDSLTLYGLSGYSGDTIVIDPEVMNASIDLVDGPKGPKSRNPAASIPQAELNKLAEKKRMEESGETPTVRGGAQPGVPVAPSVPGVPRVRTPAANPVSKLLWLAPAAALFMYLKSKK